jgi:hypothetical protein
LTASPAAAATARLFALRYLVKQAQGPSPEPMAAWDEARCLEFLSRPRGGKPNRAQRRAALRVA